MSHGALNMFTVRLAFELKDDGIAVNSVNRPKGAGDAHL
jgi:NAD(P)-dependent dehydrogenase (short-subunit alcohol dehydrogenase family)